MDGGNDDQYSLKWNNFQNNLATGFHDLLQEEMMLDVTLAMEGKYLQAHKIVLSVCSPYFKDLFKLNPCKHPIIILKDVSHQHMSDMLEFMYLGEANVRQDDLSGFLKLAETLKVKGLAGDKANENEAPSQHVRRQPLQVPKKKKADANALEADDLDPGDPEFNPGGGEPRRKRRRSSPPPKTDTVMPSISSSALPIPLANPKQEIADEEVELLDNQDEGDALSQLLDNAPKQEHDHQEFDDSNFDNTLDDTGDGAQENDFDMSAGPSNPDESTDQVPQGLGTTPSMALRIKPEISKADTLPFPPDPIVLEEAYPNLTVRRKSTTASTVTMASEKQESDDDSVVVIDSRKNERFEDVLRRWARNHNLTLASLDELLIILRNHGFPDLSANPSNFKSAPSPSTSRPATARKKIQPLNKTISTVRFKPDNCKMLTNLFWPEPSATSPKSSPERRGLRSSTAALQVDGAESSPLISTFLSEQEKQKKEMEEFRNKIRSDLDELKKIVVAKHLTATVRPMAIAQPNESPAPPPLTGPLRKKLDVILGMLPVDSVETFNHLETYLEDGDLRNEFENYLAKLGGFDVVETARKITGHVIPDHVAQLFTWSNGIGKTRLEGLNVGRALIGGVGKALPNMMLSEEEIKRRLAFHIRYSKARLKKGKARPWTKTENEYYDDPM